MAAEDETTSMETFPGEIVLVTQPDNWKFVVNRQVIELHSPVVKSQLKGHSGDTDIPIQNVDGPVFKKVLAYVRHHRLPHKKELTKREKDIYFMDVDGEMLFKLILAANELQMKRFLQLLRWRAESMLPNGGLVDVAMNFNYSVRFPSTLVASLLLDLRCQYLRPGQDTQVDDLLLPKWV